MSAAKVTSEQKPLTESQLKEFRIASNRVSLESLRYAGDICGYTALLTETIAALEKIVQGDPARNLDSVNCRQLYAKAAKSNYREEPLLHAIKISLKWGASDGSGEFMVGNLVDPIYAARLKSRERHSDGEVYRRQREIHCQYLGPYYRQLKTDKEKTREE
jgi:hypothetical protein